MGVICNLFGEEEKDPYLQEGPVVIINFKTENDSWAKPISIHNENSLKTAIQLFKQAIGFPDRKIKKAVYGKDGSELNLKQKISELNIDFSSDIIVYF